MRKPVYDPSANESSDAPTPKKLGRPRNSIQKRESIKARSVHVENGREDLSADPDLAAPVAAESAEETLEQAITRLRKKRKPFGAATYRLAWEKIPGYFIHWFNDAPGRVQQAEDAGYAHVKDKDGKNVVRHVNQSDGRRAFLMKLPEEFYREDLAAKHKLAQEKKDALRVNPVAAAAQGKKGAVGKADNRKFYAIGEDMIEERQSADPEG